MPAPLTPQQQAALEKHLGFFLGPGERFFWDASVQMSISGSVPEATLIHCGGGASEPFWDARGLKGYYAGRDEQKRRQWEELTQVAARIFAEDGTLRFDRLGPFLGESFKLFNQIFSGGNPFDREPGLMGKQMVVILGFWRSMGTLMLWRVLRRVGLEPARLNPLMIHDNMPDLGVLERNTYWPGRINAWFQFCQYLAWAMGAFADHPVLVQKNSSHVYWLQALDALLAERAVYLFSIRHPVPSAVSLANTFAKDVDQTLSSCVAHPTTDAWWNTVERATGMPREEWDRLPLLEKAIENWAAYHVLTDLNGRVARRVRIHRFGDDIEAFLDRTLPVNVTAPLEEGERAAPSPRSFDRYMTPAVIDRAAAAITRAEQRFATFDLRLPELPLV